MFRFYFDVKRIYHEFLISAISCTSMLDHENHGKHSILRNDKFTLLHNENRNIKREMESLGLHEQRFKL